MIPLLHFFQDPILTASTLGTMLMGLASSLVGVLVYVRKRALIGETLSHATYPGIVLGIGVFSIFFDHSPLIFPIVVLLGAFVSGFLGIYVIYYLESKLSLNSDTALCFVLSTFLGVGVLLASKLQFSEPVWFQRVQALLYGQTATMLTVHVYIYAVLAFVISVYILLLYSPLKIIHFDYDFAKVLRIFIKPIEFFTLILLVFAIVIGIRSVGVVLMAGMLIAPAAAARQFVRKFWQMFVLSSFFGVGIGFLGLVFSVNGSIWFQEKYGQKISLPAGPIILIIATLIVLFALIFERKRGLISRIIRRNQFKMNCVEENILKFLSKSLNKVHFSDLREVVHLSIPVLWGVLTMMKLKKLVAESDGFYLTKDGNIKAMQIIRLHRLWEVYLFKCLDVQRENVHKSAEEMEHIITPELEEELTELLGDPKKDPHDQIIPRKEGLS
ncbi:MAG: ABC transporter permease [Chlamydiae bacterium]|nr:ABC transporter permease [Chlamydiota bacterium]